MWSINSFFQTRVSPCVNLYDAVVQCILSFLKAGLPLLSSRESSLNLSDNVNDRLCSARNATTIAPILATLSKMCTVGVGGTSGVLDGDVEAYSILVVHHTWHLLLQAYSLREWFVVFQAEQLRFFRCFNRWTCCFMVPRTPCVYSMSTLHNMQLAVPGISTFLIRSFNTIDNGPWVQLSFGNLEAGSGVDTLVSSHSHCHLFGMSFSISWSFFSCSSLCLSMIIYLGKRIRKWWTKDQQKIIPMQINFPGKIRAKKKMTTNDGFHIIVIIHLTQVIIKQRWKNCHLVTPPPYQKQHFWPVEQKIKFDFAREKKIWNQI